MGGKGKNVPSPRAQYSSHSGYFSHLLGPVPQSQDTEKNLSRTFIPIWPWKSSVERTPKRRSLASSTNTFTAAYGWQGQSLDGGDMLPGLNLPLREVFAPLAEGPAPKKRPKR